MKKLNTLPPSLSAVDDFTSGGAKVGMSSLGMRNFVHGTLPEGRISLRGDPFSALTNESMALPQESV